jgi:exopolyphosphatase / guanosine-5'-triphosphate,3'-diphosphate pyrophosphatase
VLALRIAVVLCHARRDPTAGRLSLQRLDDGYRLALDSDWAAAHPQSMFLLREEARAWSRLPWPFELVVD